MSEVTNPNEIHEIGEDDEAYGVEISGGWGEFFSTSSKVIYFSTNAQFKENPDDDRVNALIKHMTPVREIIDTKGVEFGELLQRDLDDYRVAEDMVPYLLNDGAKGPVFFPPILAVLLPYRGNQPSQIETITTRSADHGARVESKKYEDLIAGPYFKLSRLTKVDGQLNRTYRIAKLHWNGTHSKLVVIDGQHRAMALLAMYRTIHDSWDSQRGGEYRHFYEDKIKRLLDGRNFPEIEVPVTIALFPELYGERGKELHTAARKLFVDVNKSAKPPSNSRLILLSDQGIINVVTRKLLEYIRKRDDELRRASPQAGNGALLVTIEYDSHSTADKEYEWKRPTAMTNLEVLRMSVEFSFARRVSFRKNVSIDWRGQKEPKFEHIVESLGLRHKLGNNPTVNEDGEEKAISWDDCNLEYCHPELQDKIFDLFLKKYGVVIETILRSTQPYFAHVQSVAKLNSQLSDITTEEKLVRQALFDGVGTFWTIKNFGEDFQKKLAPFNDKELEVGSIRKPSAVKAWEHISKIKKNIAIEMSKTLLNSDEESDVNEVIKLGNKTQTIACQMGLVMTAMHLQWLFEIDAKDSQKFAQILSTHLNEVQSGVSSRGANRSLVMTYSNKFDSRFNQLSQLNTKMWVEFRCLWIELLAERQVEFEAELRREFAVPIEISMSKSIIEARETIFQILKKDVRNRIKHIHSGNDVLEIEATKTTLNERFKAFEYWFDWSEEKFLKNYRARRDSNGEFFERIPKLEDVTSDLGLDEEDQADENGEFDE